MRFERLVIEADDSTFALDFHPKLTVISSVGQVEREGLINELVGSLSSSRPGVHAEVVADNGGHFAIFRPRGARPLVVDVDASADVSARFTDAEGEIDLLSVAGMTARDASGPCASPDVTWMPAPITRRSCGASPSWIPTRCGP